MIGIIGGTGSSNILDGVDIIDELVIDTKYGKSPEISIFELNDNKIAFMSRHSKGHSVPPHKINYMANIKAFKDIGVDRVIATNSVGSIDKSIGPGSLVIPDNFLDFTQGRNLTFFDDKVVHIDCTYPYCNELRNIISKTGKVIDKGVYVCTQGPRFETGAEIQFYKQIGGTIVGMTGVPEVILAREQEICYASICIVSNYAAQISDTMLTADEVIESMNDSQEKVVKLLFEVINKVPLNNECQCQKLLKNAML